MCGIIGYLGDREATPILMESLKRLEYRGYDSAGVAVLAEAKKGSAQLTSVTKSEAKVDTLIEKLQANMPTGKGTNNFDRVLVYDNGHWHRHALALGGSGQRVFALDANHVERAVGDEFRFAAGLRDAIRVTPTISLAEP